MSEETENNENNKKNDGKADLVERVIMQEIRDEFTANAEHFDITMMRILEQNERLIVKLEIQDIDNIDAGNPEQFEVELFDLINKHTKYGLSKPDLVKKMTWATGNCEFS